MPTVFSVLSCEGVQPSTLDNMYWKIEEKRDNLWNVFFRNVGIKYEVAQWPKDDNSTTMLFEFREIGPNYSGIFNHEYLWHMRDTDVMKCWADNNQAYEWLEDDNGNKFVRLTGSTDPNLVFTRKRHNNIVDAAMEHFNSIQRGEFHPNAKNTINPNAHGRGTNVLTNVNNTFGVHDNNVWPTDNQGSCQKSNIGSNQNPCQGFKTSGSGPTSASISSPGRGVRSPLDQFTIREWLTLMAPILANLHFTYTNMTFYLTIVAFVVVTLSLLAINYEKVEANTWSVGQESVYATVYSIVINQINTIKGQNFYPFIYSLFVFILINNLIGMVPYSFAPTSHFVLTFFISFTIVFGSTILGFVKHKLEFFSLFVPTGCPLGLLPLLVIIEFISYLARNISLGLRLAANILSGHMLLNILSEFTYNIMDTNIIYFFIGIIPLIFIAAFSGLEFGIAFIQSQVFVVLSSSYIKDSLELH